MISKLILGLLIAAIFTITVSITTLAYAQTTGLIMQESFVNTIWGLIAAIMAGFMTLSSIAIFWAKKAKQKAELSGNKKVAETLGKVISALETGQQFVEQTQKQDVKIKQIGDILYGFMGPKADEIKDKYQVRISELTKDVDNSVKGSVEYNKKLQELYDLYEEVRTQVAKAGDTPPPVLSPGSPIP